MLSMHTETLGLRVQSAGATDKGCIRPDNEDGFLCDPEHRVFVVCDGMGGEACGEVASRLALEEMRRWVPDLPQPMPAVTEGLLKDAFMAAHTCIVAEGERREVDMGTTVVALVLGEDRAVIAHIGDSRCYRLRERRLEQLTTDHSVVAQWVAKKTITPEAARTHNLRHVITRAIRTKDASIEVDSQIVELQPGDAFLLCSDGLNDSLSDAAIAEALQESVAPRRNVDTLIERALEARARDNVTAVVVRLAQKGRSR
jgi:protein phosphatase